MIEKQAEYIARYVVEHFGLSLGELRGRSPLYRSEVRSLAVCLIYDLLLVTRQTATKLSGH